MEVKPGLHTAEKSDLRVKRVHRSYKRRLGLTRTVLQRWKRSGSWAECWVTGLKSSVWWWQVVSFRWRDLLRAPEGLQNAESHSTSSPIFLAAIHHLILLMFLQKKQSSWFNSGLRKHEHDISDNGWLKIWHTGSLKARKLLLMNRRMIQNSAILKKRVDFLIYAEELLFKQPSVEPSDC